MSDTIYVDPSSNSKLLASERPPKQLKFTTTNPISQKLRSIRAKIGTAVGNVGNAVQSKLGNGTIGQAAMGATKVATAALASKLLGSIAGKAVKPILRVQQATSLLSLGVNIIEELDPAKLRRPLIEGPSVDGLQLGKDLVETTAQGIVGSMIAGMPLASGLPPTIKTFKTLALIKGSPRYLRTPGVVSPANTANLLPTGIQIYPQSGLLEDEIMHRLVLLAENVYQPIVDYASKSGYPNIEILEVLRSENNRMSSHERGEAIDLTLVNGSVTQLYNLAIWIRDNIAYDQLILCHSNIRSGQSWLHISFNLTSRRRQVFTKTFNDDFIPGLHVYSKYTDPTILAADKALASARDIANHDVIQRLSARDSRLSPVGINTPEQTAGPKSTSVAIPGGGGAGPLPGQTKPTEFSPYIGHPGGSCGLPAMIDHDNGGGVETPSFMTQVEEAQNEVWIAHNSDTAWFNENGSVVNEVEYCTEVARVLRSYGFCAAAGGPPDEVGVKVNNEWNDQYDLVNGSTSMPQLLYTVTCRPARF
jgi:hypothetical protein